MSGRTFSRNGPAQDFLRARDALVRKVDIVVEDGLLKALRSEQGKVS